MEQVVNLQQKQHGIIFNRLDSYLFIKLLQFLELSEIEILYQSKPQLFSLPDVNIWEHLVKEKKLHYFLASSPAFNYEQQIQEYIQQCSQKPVDQDLIEHSFNDQKLLEQHLLPKIINIDELNGQIELIDNWRKIFFKYYNKIFYSGTYIGDYDSHGQEILQVFQYGYFVFFVKITGDPNVPEGKITFYMKLTEDQMNGIGYIQLADQGYQSPRWGYAAISAKKKKLNNLKDQQCESQNQIHQQIKVDWFIKQELVITFTQRLRFAIWKEGHKFEVKNKQKFLNIMYRDFSFGSNISFSSSESPNQFFENNNNHNNNFSE